MKSKFNGSDPPFPINMPKSQLVALWMKVGSSWSQFCFNSRPISKPHFLSKALKAEMCGPRQSYIDYTSIPQAHFQCGFKAPHSTETALLSVFSDLFLSVDFGYSAVLILLDPTEFTYAVGLLKWLLFYLSNRSLYVQLCQFSSLSILQVKYGVPHRSILAPLLIAIYVLPLRFILRKLKMMCKYCIFAFEHKWLSLSSGSIR